MDLVAIGLLSAAEAEELHAMETTAANPSHDGYHHLRGRGGKDSGQNYSGDVVSRYGGG